MSELKQKYFLGRKVKSEKTITRGPNVEFGALYEAEGLLKENGYFCGFLDGNNPMGISFTEPIFKWHTLSKEDKAKLDGVMISSDWRNGDVKIIFFED